MEPIFVAIGTDGKVWVVADPDQALSIANVSHVYEVVPVGRTSQLLATLSGTGSPYTITSGSGASQSSGTVKTRK